MILEELRKRGRTHAAVDMDGTLIDTGETFSIAITQASQFLGINRLIIDQCVNGIRHEFNVNPVIVHVAILIAARTLQIPDTDSQVVAALERIDQIYTTDVPETFPGAIAVVDALNARFTTVLTTHAEINWTDHKKLKAGFTGKFARTHCFEVGIPKSEQWSDFFANSPVSPEKWIVIGDDLQADLAVPARLGSYTIHVSNGGTKTFSPEKANNQIKPSLSIFKIAELLEL